MKKLTLLALAVASVASATADDVSFTRHAYDASGDYLFGTYAAPDAPLSTMIRPTQGEGTHYEFILLSNQLTPVHKFSINVPSTDYYITRLEFAGQGTTYIQEFLVTQHLFNDDDLYEVVFYNSNGDWNIIFNEKGKVLGQFPGDASRLYQNSEGEVFLYAEHDGYNSPVSALYSINKSSTSVASLKSEGAKMSAYPNPVGNDEMLTLTLPEAAVAAVTVSVFNTNGVLLIKNECKAGETEIAIPAYRLSEGVNPVVAVDAEGNILATGKVVKE
ncbi:MAG: hypothetical protein K2M88_04145 [Muribaculaceae bacterium]|nr:hypothetical protein [Muribaculaceae bacterium]